MKKFLLIILLSLGAKQVVASEIVAVNSNTCQKVASQNQAFILVLKRGENVIDALLTCAKDAQLTSASLSGLGALENPTLAYYNLASKQYQNKNFSGIFELSSLNGNLAQIDGKTKAHIHVTLSDKAYHLLGGHLTQALVGATVELTVLPLPGKISRKHDDKTGLDLISAQA